MVHAGMTIEKKPEELEVAIAWMHAAQASGNYSKYASFWNDTEQQVRIIQNVTLHQFDELMHAYGHKFLMCLLDYFVSNEDYVKCAAIVRQVRSHSSFYGDKLPTANRKN
jgi:hypothetical protein